MRLQANVLEVYTTIAREGRAMCVKQHTQSQSRRKYSSKTGPTSAACATVGRAAMAA